MTLYILLFMLKLENITDWQDMIGNVCWGDCLDFLKLIPDKSIDLVVTDPPYGIGIDGQKKSVCNNPKHNRKKHEFLGWDKEIPRKEYFDEIFRISKNQIIFGANYFIKYLYGEHKGWIIWDKGQHGLTMSDCEIIYSSFDCPTRIVTYNRVELLKDNSKHPTQKPLELMRWILVNYSKKTDLICDPFLGSGTTARACKDLGRRWIGIEKEYKYCLISEERLKQGNLFTN